MMLSRNIKKYRTARGMTQEQFADALGVSSQAVSKWETTETYPDGSLLVPLANALGVSLDELFDNGEAYMSDLSSKLRTLMKNSVADERFHLARDVGWQIERAMFGTGVFPNGPYDPDEIKNAGMNSYIDRDGGFTHISNGRAPFFSVFPDYGNSFAEVIGDGEEMRRIFEILSSEDTMRAALFVHRNARDFCFDALYFAKECDIADDRLDAVIDGMKELRLIYDQDVELNGERKKLYFTAPSHVLIALLLFAHEMDYKGGYQLQADSRTRPYLC